MTTDVETRLREMLAERAASAVPAEDIVELVQARVGARRGRWVVPAIAAASVVAVLVGSLGAVDTLRSHPAPASQLPQPGPAACKSRGGVPPQFSADLRTAPASALITAQEAGQPFTPEMQSIGNVTRPALDAGKPAFSWVTTQTNPAWWLIEQVWQFNTASHAAQAFTAVVGLERCAPVAKRLIPKGTPPADTEFYALSHEDTRLLPFGRTTGLPSEGFVVDTRIGRSVVSVLLNGHAISDGLEVAASVPAPSSHFFIALANAVRAKAAGEKLAATLPVLPGTAPVTLPAGFLTLADLGSGWTVGTEGGDTETVTSQTTVGPGTSCGTANLALTQPGHSQTYRGVQPRGDKEWLLTETVVLLTPQAAAQARAAMLQPCADYREVTLAAGTVTDLTAAVLGHTLGFANSYTLTGNTLIWLTTLPGGASGGNTSGGPVPLPGGIHWLTATSLQALGRVEGQ